MDLTILDERQFSSYLQEQNKRLFQKYVSDFEKAIAPSMRAQGYKRINQKERTIVFSFGEMTFTRSRWKKGTEIRTPLDEKLGLVPRERLSKELLFQLTRLASWLPYRKVAETFAFLKQIYVTKNAVQRAVEKAGQLLEEKEVYRIDGRPTDNQAKITPEILYIEGDGVWVKRSDSDKKSQELTHFIVHTGPEKTKRHQLTNKVEVISTNHQKAKDKLIDIIYTHFNVTKDTVIVTNSDGGAGYSPRIFHEMVKGFQPKSHHHFWDSYHVNQAIKKHLKPFPPDLTNLAFQAIQMHDKAQLRTVLDTADSLLSDDKWENFQVFKRQLLANFAYTQKPEAKGLPAGGIGVMESQHRKITYRMKNRGMYWSRKGADTLSQVIILDQEDNLRDLFLGSWRKDCEKIKAMKSVASFCRSPKKGYDLPFLIRRSKAKALIVKH